ncbi:MAG TPA: hypothetical protein VMJ90_09510 [Anaerolineales bacterium]|nr:hypothetical protein [Anaerolineales bacterium]
MSALLLSISLLLHPMHVLASGRETLPPMEQFAVELMNGEPDDLKGIYIPGVMAYEVLPQPEDSPAFVAPEDDALTRFEMASEYETTGLLAHNHLAGADFFLLEDGQLIHLIYGDGRTETFIIRRFLRYQALSPNSVTSDFVDLETGEHLTASQLFLKIYNRPGDLVLQTCIQAEDEPSWGRLFIIAAPYDQIEPRSLPERLALQ